VFKKGILIILVLSLPLRNRVHFECVRSEFGITLLNLGGGDNWLDDRQAILITENGVFFEALWVFDWIIHIVRVILVGPALLVVVVVVYHLVPTRILSMFCRVGIVAACAHCLILIGILTFVTAALRRST
jgi:hypothetical protein